MLDRVVVVIVLHGPADYAEVHARQLLTPAAHDLHANESIAG